MKIKLIHVFYLHILGVLKAVTLFNLDGTNYRVLLLKNKKATLPGFPSAQ